MDTGTAIAIDLEVSGVDKTIEGIRKVAAQLAKLNSAVKSAAVNASGMGASGGGGGGSSNYYAYLSQQSKSYKMQQNIYNVQQNYYILQQQQNNVVKQSNAGLLGFGGSLLAQVYVVERTIGALFGLASSAVEAGIKLRDIGITSGGNRMESGQLSVMGNALGINMGQLAREFSDRISHDGAAAGFAARGGVHDYGLFGDIDKAKNLLQWIKALRGMSPADAVRAARATGTESLLPTRHYSDQQMQNLQGDVNTKLRIMDPKFIQDAQDFSLAFARVGDAITNLLAAVIKPFLPEIIKFFDDLATGINKMADWANDNQSKIRGIVDIFKGISMLVLSFGLLGWEELFKGIKEVRMPSKPAERHASAMEAHAKALEEATYAMKNGIYGGGERARGAVPSRWMGMNADRYVGEAARLGAFAL